MRKLFQPGEDPRRNQNQAFQPGNRHRWPRGVSGNPAGKPKAQREFEEALADALAGENPCERAKELADLVWAAARKGEAWAVQILFARLAPQPLQVRMEVDRSDEIDFSKFTDAEFEALGRLLEKAAGDGSALLEGGTSAPEPA